MALGKTGKLTWLLLSTTSCSGRLEGGCRKQKIGSVYSYSSDFFGGVSLMQADISAYHTQHRTKHRQLDLPDILTKAAAVESQKLPDILSKAAEATSPPIVSVSPTTVVAPLSGTTTIPVSPIPIVRHTKPARGNTSGVESDDHKHPSIFKLHFGQLDKTAFWVILLSMLVFTILVDRLEWFAAKKAEHNMARQMYLNRLNAELMMFGLVSTVVFITEQFWEPTPENAVLFEFVDIFCSMGACGLFLTCLVLFILHHWMERRWRGFGGQPQAGHHMRQTHRIQCEQATASALLEQVLRAESLQSIDVQHCEFVIMSARFKRSHSLPDTFNYSEYLKLCLTDSICDLMNINWVSWLLVLAFTAIGYLAHVLHPSYTPQGYVTIFSCGVWTLAVVHVLVLVVVLQAKIHLTRGLGCNSLKSLQESLRQAVQYTRQLSVEPVPRLSAKLVSALEQIIQIVGLATSFQGSFFVMHVLFNVSNIKWRLLLVMPIVVDGIILLPAIIAYFTVIKAYYSPEHAIVDSTLEWSTKLEEDLRFVAKQLQPGEPLDKYRNSMRTGSREAFLQSLSDMGLHVSPPRAFRIYSAFENNGGLDLNALFDALREQNPVLGRQDSFVGRAGALIQESLVGRAAWGSPSATSPVATTMVAAPSAVATSSIHTQDHYEGLRGLAAPQQTQSIPGSASSLTSMGGKYNIIY